MSQPKLPLSKFIRSMKTWISVLTIQFVELFLKSSSTTLLLKIDLANFVFLTELSSVALLVTESFLQLHLSQTWPNLLLSSQKMNWESSSFAQASQARKMLRQLISFLNSTECYDSRVVNSHTYRVWSRIFKFTHDSYFA